MMCPSLRPGRRYRFTACSVCFFPSHRMPRSYGLLALHDNAKQRPTGHLGAADISLDGWGQKTAARKAAHPALADRVAVGEQRIKSRLTSRRHPWAVPPCSSPGAHAALDWLGEPRPSPLAADRLAAWPARTIDSDAPCSSEILGSFSRCSSQLRLTSNHPAPIPFSSSPLPRYAMPVGQGLFPRCQPLFYFRILWKRLSVTSPEKLREHLLALGREHPQASSASLARDYCVPKGSLACSLACR